MVKKVLLNISGKKAIEAEFIEKDISFFKLDLSNPRLIHLGLKTEKQAEEAIWSEKDIGSLYKAIFESKGISDPIFSTPDGKVIEGNRRIVCLRKIKEKYGEENIFPKQGYEKIPVYILPKDTSPLDLDILLARLHVSGKKEWKSLNQAEHIYNLKEKYGLNFEDIKNLIGMSKGKIHQKYWAYNQTKEFLSRYSKESINRYSFFEEAYKKKNIKSIVEDKKQREEFYNWIVNEKFDKTGAKDIRELARILDNPPLKELFAREGIKKAYFDYQRLYEMPDDSLKLISRLNGLIKKLSDEEIKSISKDKEKVEELKKLRREIDELLEKF